MCPRVTELCRAGHYSSRGGQTQNNVKTSEDHLSCLSHYKQTLSLLLIGVTLSLSHYLLAEEMQLHYLSSGSGHLRIDLDV